MKILLVDDDQDMREILSEFLQEEGYDVVSACDGESALNSLKSQRYNLVILDYKLQGIDGLQVLEQVQQIDSDLIAIMISGFGSEETKQKARQLGVYEFLDKPFDVENMLNVIKKAIGRKD